MAGEMLPLLPSLLFAALLAAPGLPGPAQGGAAPRAANASAGSATALPAAAPALATVPLETLRSRPLHHLGQRLEFALQLAPHGAHPDPLWTRYGPRAWRNVRAWGDQQFPWVAEHYGNPAPYLFVRRGTAAEVVLASARPHERFLVRATVREVLLGEPWIEIHSALRVEPSLGEGTVLHAAKALELRAAGQWELAASQLERARSAPMPDAAAAELTRVAERWLAEQAAKAKRR